MKRIFKILDGPLNFVSKLTN